MVNSKFENVSDFHGEIDKIGKYFSIYLELKYLYKNNESSLHGYSHILSIISSRDDLFTILIHSAITYCDFKADGFIKSATPKFIKILRILESFLIRSKVYGNNLQVTFDKILLMSSENLVDKLFSDLKNNSSIAFGSLDDFILELTNSGSLNKGTIMSVITHVELKLRGIPSGSTGYVQFEKTHEHIIAQKLKYTEYDDEVSESEFIGLISERKDSIGNALLLPQGFNSKAGNKSFSKKLNIYEESNSYAAKGNVEPPIMNLLNKKTFNFNDVQVRSKEISIFIKKHNIYYDE